MQQAIDILKRSSLEVELAAKEGEVSLLVHMFLLSSVDRLLRAGTFLVFYRMTYVQCICIMWCVMVTCLFVISQFPVKKSEWIKLIFGIKATLGLSYTVLQGI